MNVNVKAENNDKDPMEDEDDDPQIIRFIIPLQHITYHLSTSSQCVLSFQAATSVSSLPSLQQYHHHRNHSRRIVTIATYTTISRGKQVVLPYFNSVVYPHHGC
jgi:hypothetical protein